MKKTIIAIVVCVGLSVAYWLISPLFIKTMSSEPLSELKISQDEPRLVATGQFMDGEPGHHAKGGLSVYLIGESQYAIRFDEDFEVTNGPDLFVHLGDEKIVLGALKGSVGSQNYIVPKGIDPGNYDSVIIWCRAFGVNFGSAKIHPVNFRQ